jgi:nucleoid DNA-binding protein
MTTITKRDLVVTIATASGLTQQQTQEVVQQFLDTVTDHVADGNEVVLRNFGAFQVKRSKPKVGRNPAVPGSEVTIPARTIVKFKPGKEMKDRVALLDSKAKGKPKKGK